MKNGRGKVFRVGEIGQWAGMAACFAGLILELVTGADVGFTVLTGGSLVWAVFTKVKYYVPRKGAHRRAARKHRR